MKNRKIPAALILCCLLLGGCGKAESSTADSGVHPESSAVSEIQSEKNEQNDADAKSSDTAPAPGSDVTEESSEGNSSAPGGAEDPLSSQSGSTEVVISSAPAAAVMDTVLTAFAEQDADTVYNDIPACVRDYMMQGGIWREGAFFADYEPNELAAAACRPFTEAEAKQAIRDYFEEFDFHRSSWSIGDPMTLDEADALADDAYNDFDYDSCLSGSATEITENVTRFLKESGYTGSEPEYCVVEVTDPDEPDDRYGMIMYRLDDGWHSESILEAVVENIWEEHFLE